MLSCTHFWAHAAAAPEPCVGTAGFPLLQAPLSPPGPYIPGEEGHAAAVEQVGKEEGEGTASHPPPGHLEEAVVMVCLPWLHSIWVHRHHSSNNVPLNQVCTCRRALPLQLPVVLKISPAVFKFCFDSRWDGDSVSTCQSCCA